MMTCNTHTPLCSAACRFDDELDKWGRPKKAITPMPTDVLPDNVDVEKVPDINSLSDVGDVARMLKLPLPGSWPAPGSTQPREEQPSSSKR